MGVEQGQAEGPSLRRTGGVPSPNGRRATSTATVRRTTEHAHRAPRRIGGPLGDRRGLTAAGALVILLLAGSGGALIDLALGRTLWVMFSIGFVGATLLSASRVHVEDLAASIVMVPLSYAVIGAFITLVQSNDPGLTTGIKQSALDVMGVLVYSAPVLALATVVATAIALHRGRSVTLARRRAKARAAGRPIR